MVKELIPAEKWRAGRKQGKRTRLHFPTTNAVVAADVAEARPIDAALDVVHGYFPSTPSIADAAEACIAAVCSLLLKETEGCAALVLEGPASSGKTTALNFLMGVELRNDGIVIVSDSFTAASFVSHAANRQAAQLAQNDLLPRVQHRALIVPDLAPTLSAREEDLTKNLGILTRVLDGQGYESDSGTHGHRGYVGDYRFALLAATTPLSKSAWKVLGRLGNRIVQLETGSETTTTDELIAAMRPEIGYRQKVTACAEATSEFLTGLWKELGGYGSVVWDAASDDEELVSVIAQVALWVVRCRGSVAVKYEELTYEIERAEVEAPHRLASALCNLARGHAIACGRRTLSREDVQLAVRIGLDSMPLERRRVVRALVRAEDGILKSEEVQKALGQSRPTTLKVMKTLGTLGAVAYKDIEKATCVSLVESEQWLLDEENRWALARVP